MDDRPWAELRGLTREEYQAEVDERAAQGFVVVDFESYTSGGEQRYAAIWEKKAGFAWRVATNRTELQFAAGRCPCPSWAPPSNGPTSPPPRSR